MTYETKTRVTQADVTQFIEAVPHPVRKSDAWILVEMMRRVSGLEPRMWGPTIVGFGNHHYVYETGQSGDICQIGFSPRKASLSVYLLCGDRDAYAEQLSRLGKHKLGQGGCLYINELADVDLGVLEEMTVGAWTQSKPAKP